MAECGGLENRFSRKGDRGSNPRGSGFFSEKAEDSKGAASMRPLEASVDAAGGRPEAQRRAPIPRGLGKS